MTLASDVRDVIYLSWTVSVDNVQSLVPVGVELFQRNGKTILTVLTYRHGNFGPSALGRLRAMFPSPLQSNWRLYVSNFNGRTRQSLVLFICNVFDNALYAIGTRLFSDVLASHTSTSFSHGCVGTECETRIVDGKGKLSLHVAARGAQSASLAGEFDGFFDTWAEAVRFLTLQEAAIANVADEGRVAYSDIDLPIELTSVEPMIVTAFSPGDWLRSLGAEGPPLCFRVPYVRFRALSDSLIK